MASKEAQKRAHEAYELKRKGKPRYSGYLTAQEKEKFIDTVNLGNYSSEKEMLLAAVDLLHKKLSK